jgi:hypothetical protein
VALFVLARLALAPGSPVPIGTAAVVALLPLPVLLLRPCCWRWCAPPSRGCSARQR